MKKVLLIVCSFFLVTAVQTQIIHVPGDYPTIQQGIDAATNGDTVLVQPGTYSENINFLGKEITVGSLLISTQDTTYVSQTVIDGNQSGSVVTFENEESHEAILKGFTLTNGNSSTSGGGIMCIYSNPTLSHLILTDNYTKYNGGGIICGAYASPVMENVKITKNTAGGDGGGIYCYNHCNPILENVLISANTTPNHGGGICCLESCNLTLSHITIEKNSANEGGGIFSAFNSNFNLTDGNISSNTATKGGGIYMTQNIPALSNLELSSNQANIGGGIFCDNADPVMQNVKIVGNMSTDKGGGISMYQSSLEVKNGIIKDNVAWIGGGVFCLDSNPLFIDVLIGNNEAVVEGEGIGGGMAFLNSIPLLVNVTMADNYAATLGGGVYLSMNSQLNLSNCILWNNNPIEVYFDPNSGANALTVSYCDFQGGTDSIITNNNGEIFWLEGNINEDPVFVGIGEHPYQVSDLSPCIDAGIPDTTGLDLPEDDLAGEVRIFNDRVDMGAYEWNIMVGLSENAAKSIEITVYPNPFRNNTTIKYSLEADFPVSLVIYDHLGQQLVTLVNENQLKGDHEITWNAKGLSAGVYYFRLVAGKKTSSGSLIIIH